MIGRLFVISALAMFLAPSPEASGLLLLERIPKEHQNIFFKTMPFIAVYNQSILFATDNQEHMIYRIDLVTDDVTRIGRPGHGPGDLFHPWVTVVGDNTLFVADDAGINLFDTHGAFVTRFKILNRLISMAAGRGDIFVAETGSDTLIVQYDKQGKKIRSFGKKYHPDKDAYPGWPPTFIDRAMNSGRLMITDTGILFLSSYFGELFKYDLNGNLVAQNAVADENSIAKNRRYYLNEGQALTPSGEFETLRIFEDACYFEGRIYALMGIAGWKQERYAEITVIDAGTLKPIERLLLKNTGADAPLGRIRNIVVCAVKEWPRALCLSMYDERSEDFVINIYKER